MRERAAVSGRRGGPAPEVAAQAEQRPALPGHEGVDVAEQRLADVQRLELDLAFDEQGLGQMRSAPRSTSSSAPWMSSLITSGVISCRTQAVSSVVNVTGAVAVTEIRDP